MLSTSIINRGILSGSGSVRHYKWNVSLVNGGFSSDRNISDIEWSYCKCDAPDMFLRGGFTDHGGMNNHSFSYDVTFPPTPDPHVTLLNATYLETKLGPRREALYKVIIITIIYCIVFVVGIMGNVSTCIVIARNRFMQTATNIYLFNLAVSDLLIVVLGLPQETYIYWSAYPYVFGETFCLIRTMAAETSTNASILTITAFTVERYVAICHPMRSQTMSSLRRVIKVIVAIWIVSGICSIPMVVQFGIVHLKDDTGQIIPESATCGIRQAKYLRYAFEMSTFLFFIAPMSIITALYALIGLAIRRSTLNRTGSDSSRHSEGNGSDIRIQQQAKARRAVLKMLGMLMYNVLWVLIFICDKFVKVLWFNPDL